MTNTQVTPIRFRRAELVAARRAAKRLGCPVSHVIRAALARLDREPLSREEVDAMRLPSGWSARQQDDPSA
jgi:hypothetical protein